MCERGVQLILKALTRCGGVWGVWVGGFCQLVSPGCTGLSDLSDSAELDRKLFALDLSWVWHVGGRSDPATVCCCVATAPDAPGA